MREYLNDIFVSEEYDATRCSLDYRIGRDVTHEILASLQDRVYRLWSERFEIIDRRLERTHRSLFGHEEHVYVAWFSYENRTEEDADRCVMIEPSQINDPTHDARLALFSFLVQEECEEAAYKCTLITYPEPLRTADTLECEDTLRFETGEEF